MEHDMATTPNGDPAAAAFSQLRREVTMLRLAVEQLADAPGKIEIPDYTETLGEIRAATQALANNYRKLCDAPALSITPDRLAAQINAASKEARATESQSLQNAQNAFIALGRELTSFVESARTADRQNKWLVGAFLFGVATCAAAFLLAMSWNGTKSPATVTMRQTLHQLKRHECSQCEAVIQKVSNLTFYRKTCAQKTILS